jgi:hypothetical protein
LTLRPLLRRIEDMVSKPFIRCACLCGVLLLTGCNVWNVIWQGIVGHGYYQVTRSSVVNTISSMTKDAIDLSALTTNSVIVYTTSANALYGKLSFTALSSSIVTIMFETYNTDGTEFSGSNGTQVAAGSSFDLETGQIVGTGNTLADFSFSAAEQLTPLNNAVFAVYSK